MLTLSAPQGITEYQKTFQTASVSATHTSGESRCQTYVWKAGLDGLKQAVWR